MRRILLNTRVDYADMVKPFSEVPGPVALPIVGCTWKYFPLIGNWDTNKLHIAGALKLSEYGPLVREEISANLKLCHVFRAEDIEQVYKTEGRYPERRSHLAINHYRLTRPHLYNTGGLLPTNGDKWWRLRSAFQKHISPLQDVRLFLPMAASIITEFINTALPKYSLMEDFLPLVSRLYLELMWMYMFGERLRAFDSVNMTSDSVPSKLIEAAEFVNLSTMHMDNTEGLWKIFKTPTYKKMEYYLQYIERTVFTSLEEVYKRRHSRRGGGTFLVEKYIENPNVDRKDINGMVVDLVLGGVDTTAYTTSFLLYNLSTNKEAQEKLRDESRELLPAEDSIVTPETLNNATYARAVLKESFRLNPISIGVSRYLLQDSVFSGYLIPKGTLMMTQNLVACRNESYFFNPDSFLPERWIKLSPAYTNVSPFLILPFSHGPRTCIARRLAEQNLLTLLLLVGRKYSISWAGKEALGIVTPLICKPDKPVKLSFNPW